MASDLETARRELLTAAEALGALLQRYGEQFWADWVMRARQRIEDGDGSAIDALLGAYGGMGSLNDVVVHPVNGHHITAEEVGPENDILSQLRSRTYAAAAHLKIELRRNPDAPGGDLEFQDGRQAP